MVKRKILLMLAATLLFSTAHAGAQTCFLNNFSSLGTLYKGSGDPMLDQAMTSEYMFLTSKFGVFPDLFYYNDSTGSNAYATTEVINPNFPDGRVAVGFGLIRSECARSASGTCVSVAIIMAHEFGHIVDFKNRVNLPGKNKELFADYLAGCYMHLRSVQFGSTNVSEAARSFYGIGDYQFNSPQHHGTPQERHDTLMAGYNYSRSQVESGKNYSLLDAVNSSKDYLSRPR